MVGTAGWLGRDGAKSILSIGRQGAGAAVESPPDIHDQIAWGQHPRADYLLARGFTADLLDRAAARKSFR